jgi:hypothetical protein
MDDKLSSTWRVINILLLIAEQKKKDLKMEDYKTLIELVYFRV